MTEAGDLATKVDGYLREALATRDGPTLAHLISKAAYWNPVAMKKAAGEIALGAARARSAPYRQSRSG